MSSETSNKEEKTILKQKPSLPNGWIICRSSTYPNTIYYFNISTGCSTWDLPDLVKKQSEQVMTSQRNSQMTSSNATLNDALRLYHKPHGTSKQKTQLKEFGIEQPWYIKHSKENSSENYPEPVGRPPGVAISRKVSENESDRGNCNVDIISNRHQLEDLVIQRNVSQQNGVKDEEDSNIWSGSTDVSLDTRFKILNNVAELTPDTCDQFSADVSEATDKSLDPNDLRSLLSLGPNDLRLLLRARQKGTTDFEQFQLDNPEETVNRQYQDMEKAVTEDDIQEEEEADKESKGLMEGGTENINSPPKRVSFDANTKMDSIEDIPSDWDDGFNSDCSDSNPVRPINLDRLASLSPDRAETGGSGGLERGMPWYIVVDSSVWLSNLRMIKILFNAQEGTNCAPILLVPWRVLHELDKMGQTEKDMRAQPTSKTAWRRPTRARRAKAFINENIKPTSYVGARLVGESCQEANKKLFPCTGADDEIINCCLRYASNNHHVIALSNDKNLCNKALVNNIHAFTVRQMKELLYDNKHQDVFDSDTPPLNMGKSQFSQFKRNINANDKPTKNIVNVVEPSRKPNVIITLEGVSDVEQKYVNVKKWGSFGKTLPDADDQGNNNIEKNKAFLKNSSISNAGSVKSTTAKKIILKRKSLQNSYETDNKRKKICFDNPKQQEHIVTQEVLVASNNSINTGKQVLIKKNINSEKSNVSANEPGSTINIVNEQKTDFRNEQTKPINVTINSSFDELMKNRKDNLKKSYETDRSMLNKDKTEKIQPKVLQQTVKRTLPTESFSAFMKSNLNKPGILQKSANVPDSSFSEYSATLNEDINTNVSEIISSVKEISKEDRRRKNKDVNLRLITEDIQKENPLDTKVVNKTPQGLPQLPPQRERQKIAFDIDVANRIEKPIQRVQPVAPVKKERVKIVYDLDKDEKKPKEDGAIKQYTLKKDNPSFATVDYKFIPKTQLNVSEMSKSATTNNTVLPKKTVAFNMSTISPKKKSSPMKNQPFTIVLNNENVESTNKVPTNETVKKSAQNIVFNVDSLNLCNITTKSNAPPNFKPKLRSKPPSLTNFKVTFGSANETVPTKNSLSDWSVKSQQAFTNDINLAFQHNKQKPLQVFEPFSTDVQCDNEVFKLTETNNRNVDPNRVNSVQDLRTDLMKGSGRNEKERVKVPPKMINFMVNSSGMKERIELRLNEWVCRLRQIMEYILCLELDRSLRLTPKYCLNFLKPPWSLHEALISLNMVLKKARLSDGTAGSQKLPVESVIDAAAQKVNYYLDQQHYQITADEYMDIYSHCYNILYYLKSNRTAEEDYTIALESLELILTDIKNLDTDENYDFGAESDDRTPSINEDPLQFTKYNKKDFNSRNEVKQYIKKHFPNAISDEDVDEENSTEIQKEMTENVFQHRNVEVDKVPDIQNVCDKKKLVERHDLDALNYESDVSSDHEMNCQVQFKNSNEAIDHVGIDLRSINLATEQTCEPVPMNRTSVMRRSMNLETEQTCEPVPRNRTSVMHRSVNRETEQTCEPVPMNQTSVMRRSMNRETEQTCEPVPMNRTSVMRRSMNLETEQTCAPVPMSRTSVMCRSMNRETEQTCEPVPMNRTSVMCSVQNRECTVDEKVCNNNNNCLNRNTDRLVDDNLKNNALSDTEKNVLQGIKMVFLYSYTYCTKYSESFQKSVQSQRDLPGVSGGPNSELNKLCEAIGILLSRFHLILDRGSKSRKAYDNLARAINDLIKLADFQIDFVNGSGISKCFVRQKDIITACRLQFQSLHSALLILMKMKK